MEDKPLEKNEIIEVLENNGLEKTKSEMIAEHFKSFFDDAKRWELEARNIVITDVSQTVEMTAARDLRISLKNLRVNAEKKRKALKEQSLREGRAIDGIANVIKALVVPIEQHLEKQERFAEIKEQEEKDRISEMRVSELQPYVDNVDLFNLRDMSIEAFNNLLESSKKAFNAIADAEKKAEDERVENERIAAEERKELEAKNEKLREERREADEKAAKAEREKEIAEQKLRDIEQAKKDKEFEEQRKIDEAKVLKKKSERETALLPDKEKLLAFADEIKGLKMPLVSSMEAQNIVNMIDKNLIETSKWLKNKINSL